MRNGAVVASVINSLELEATVTEANLIILLRTKPPYLCTSRDNYPADTELCLGHYGHYNCTLSL